ncbi:MAG TPA: helix-turn-helix domain-containing protein [Dehalococcoidia bacterium]|jgi:excisionase family DNA binding protein|nr:helix-turn-helix domain-containing protein [Dehalococcoidia bacterium]
MQVTLAEAALRLQVSEKTVRRWVHNGKLQGTQVSTDRGFQWMVDIPDALPDPQAGSGEASTELQLLRDMNALLKDRLDMMDRELETKNNQIRELHILLQQAQIALPAPQSTQSLPWWQFWRRR